MRYEVHTFSNPEVPIIFDRCRFSCERPYIPNFHSNPELIYVVEGTLQLKLDDHTVEVSAGQVGVIAGNVLHGFSTKDAFCEYDFLIIDRALCPEAVDLPERIDDPAVAAVFLQIAREMKEKAHRYPLAVVGLCKYLMALVSRQAAGQMLPQNQTSPKAELVRSAVEYIYLHFKEPLSLDALSQALNVNKYYLSHVVKEITGKTVVQILQLVRCQNAQSLLQSGRCNVSAAAYQSGFNHLSYFSKVYKECMGCAPLEDLKR